MGTSAFYNLRYGAFRTARNLTIAVMCAGSVSAEPVTVVAFGDSLMAGYGLPTEDGFVPQLQRWLDAQGAEVTVINAGVSGDTTAGGLSRVDWTLTPEVDAMLLGLGANDYLRGLPPELARANLDQIITRAEAAGVSVMLVGLQVGANYGADYKAEFDAIYPDLAETYGLGLVSSFFGALIDRTGSQEAMTAYLQADRLHPTAEGVAIIVEAIGPEVIKLAAEAAQP